MSHKEDLISTHTASHIVHQKKEDNREASIGHGSSKLRWSICQNCGQGYFLTHIMYLQITPPIHARYLKLPWKRSRILISISYRIVIFGITRRGPDAIAVESSMKEAKLEIGWEIQGPTHPLYETLPI